MKLLDFKVLTFDCYGTLIDWETGILQALRPWLKRENKTLSDSKILEEFAKQESEQEKQTPHAPYPNILYHVHQALAKRWNIPSTENDAKLFSECVKHWPVFPDSAKALAKLKQHFKLVILSNIDNDSIKSSVAKLGITFDHIYTAQDIGSYKPDIKNFEYLIQKLNKSGIHQNQILHTAQSLFHDHVPAKKLGLATCWIDRRHNQAGWGATPPPPTEIKPDFYFKSLGEMAEHAEANSFKESR